MTEPESELELDPGADQKGDDSPAAERASLSYQGSRVPWLIILIWIVFFIWGVDYLLRWIPGSWREWFSR